MTVTHEVRAEVYPVVDRLRGRYYGLCTCGWQTPTIWATEDAAVLAAKAHLDALKPEPSPTSRKRWEAERAAKGPVVQLMLRTRVPSKWLVIDRETGDQWEWRDETWKRP